jgi:hypothetical protein
MDKFAIGLAILSSTTKQDRALTVLLILIGTLFASGVFEQEIQSFSWVGIAFALATSFTMLVISLPIVVSKMKLLGK